MPSAEILTIGTEILLGEIVDTNTRHIARSLRGLGVDLFRTSTIGDNAQRIAESVRDALSRADILITTGGLGPTVDDPTREAVALAFGRQTEFREELWKQITERMARYGRTAGENQKRQAYVPQGAIPIYNPVGTAPCFIVEEGNKCVISLPGVPAEMETILRDTVIPYLQKRYDLREVIRVRVIHTAGMGESVIDEHVGELESLANPTVGLAAHSGAVDVRIAAKAKSEAEAALLIAGVEATVRQRLGEAVYGADDDTLEGAALQACARNGWTLSMAESGLGGVLIRRLQGLDSPLVLGVEDQTLGPDQVPMSTKELRERAGSRAALGVALFPGEDRQAVELCLITPVSNETRRLTYGGPPQNTPRWAANMALDLLRRTAEHATQTL
jgi:competence/damage-inducible protein CinA-like protein